MGLRALRISWISCFGELFGELFFDILRLRFTKAKKEKVLKLKLRKTLPKVHAPGPQLQFLDDDSLESLDSIFLSCIMLYHVDQSDLRRGLTRCPDESDEGSCIVDDSTT